MKLASIAEAQPVGFALVRRDSANHASMLALAALSVLAAFRLQRYNFFLNRARFPSEIIMHYAL